MAFLMVSLKKKDIGLTFLMGFKLRSKKGEIGERFAQGNGPLKPRGTKNDAYRTQLITKEPS